MKLLKTGIKKLIGSGKRIGDPFLKVSGLILIVTPLPLLLDSSRPKDNGFELLVKKGWHRIPVPECTLLRSHQKYLIQTIDQEAEVYTNAEQTEALSNIVISQPPTKCVPISNFNQIEEIE